MPKTPASSTFPKLLLVSEVARLFGVDPITVTRWAKKGKIPYIRTMGGHRRYPEEQIKKILTARSDANVQPAK